MRITLFDSSNMLSTPFSLQHLLGAAGALLALYVARNYFTRYSKLRVMEKRYKGRYAIEADEETDSKPRMIHAGLKGIRDAQRIMRVALYYDVPFMTFTSLEFALFKTYGIPTISGLLLHTGQLGKSENASRRFIDTALLISSMTLFPLPPLDLEDNDVQEPGDELISQDWSDPRSSIAISRINFLHGRWKNKISNDDLLYTLSLFLLEPPSFVNRFEWRKMTPLEEEALFTVWYHAGRCMGITGIPDTRQAMAEWAESYEAEHMVYKECNTAVARYTVDLLLYSIPRFLHGPLYYVVYSLLNERLRESFGFPKAPQWLVASMPFLLRLRSWVSILLLPRRSVPTSICPADAQKRIIEGGAAGQFCPATGISAQDAEKQGKMCPVGNHSTAATKDSAGDDLTSLPRLQPGWIENDPWYAEPAKVGTPRWIWEKIAVKPQDRWGAPRWQNKELHSATEAPHGKKVAGFRLEECGPVGLELAGREQILKEAVKLNGGKELKGPWAFQAKVQPRH